MGLTIWHTHETQSAETHTRATSRSCYVEVPVAMTVSCLPMFIESQAL